MKITKLVTEPVHLYDQNDNYLGEFKVLNDSPIFVAIFVHIEAHKHEVMRFRRKDGTLMHKYTSIRGWYVRDDKFIREEYIPT